MQAGEASKQCPGCTGLPVSFSAGAAASPKGVAFAAIHSQGSQGMQNL